MHTRTHIHITHSYTHSRGFICSRRLLICEDSQEAAATERRTLEQQLRTLEQELAAARAAAGAQGDDADKTLLRGQVLALQQQVALLTCPAASDAPPPAVSPPVVRGRDKEGCESTRERESRRARERESERARE